nr:hypothetical protein CFP56_36876 [Quercus suber]
MCGALFLRLADIDELADDDEVPSISSVVATKLWWLEPDQLPTHILHRGAAMELNLQRSFGSGDLDEVDLLAKSFV